LSEHAMTHHTHESTARPPSRPISLFIRKNFPKTILLHATYFGFFIRFPDSLNTKWVLATYFCATTPIFVLILFLPVHFGETLLWFRLYHCLHIAELIYCTITMSKIPSESLLQMMTNDTYLVLLLKSPILLMFIRIVWLLISVINNMFIEAKGIHDDSLAEAQTAQMHGDFHPGSVSDEDVIEWVDYEHW